LGGSRPPARKAFQKKESKHVIPKVEIGRIRGKTGEKGAHKFSSNDKGPSGTLAAENLLPNRNREVRGGGNKTAFAGMV